MSKLSKRLIVLINHNSGLNGAELSFFDVVRMVDQSKFIPHVILPSNGPLADKIRDVHIPVTIIPQQGWRWYYPGAFGLIKFALNWPRIWRGIRAYRKFFRQHKPALVYLNINRIFEPLLAADQLRVPVIVHFRDLPSKVTHTFVFGQKRYFNLLNRARAWVANSGATKDEIQPWTTRNVKVVYNGIDIQTFLKISGEVPQWKRPEGKKVVAMIGTLTPWKNQKDFVAMAAKLHVDHPDLCFWIIGEGSERASLVKQINALNLAEVVLLKGFITPVAPVYSQIDVLVHTMPGESFGRVFVEAMIAKVPVVAYRSGASSDILDDATTGWLVDDFNVDQLVERVRYVLKEEEVVKKVLENASREAYLKFSVERLSQEMNSIFEEMISKKSGS